MSPRTQLPDALRPLLLTWQVRQMRGEVSVPRPPDDGGADPEWSWKYEQEYGAELDDRALALQTELDVLAEKGANVAAVVAALRRIKHLAFDVAFRRLTLDLHREHVEEADVIQANLRKWLARAVDLHRRLNPDNLPDEQRRAWEDRVMALTFNESMTDEERARRDVLFDPRVLKAGPRRRPRQGNPDGRLVKVAHYILAKAKVARDHHGALLWAIGLVDRDGNLPKRRNFSRD